MYLAVAHGHKQAFHLPGGFLGQEVKGGGVAQLLLRGIGNVIGNQIYINGVAHTIAPHLRSILSAANKNILKDAFVEGDFSGNRINNISKLTINASGTSSRLLAMDGDYSSFAGELVVNWSYVRFKNITFTGRVELAEAPRR